MPSTRAYRSRSAALDDPHAHAGAQSLSSVDAVCMRRCKVCFRRLRTCRRNGSGQQCANSCRDALPRRQPCAPPFHPEHGIGGRVPPPLAFPETIGSLERFVLGLERGKRRMFRGKVILPSLLGLALILSLVSSAEARRWRFNFFGLHIYGGYSPRSVVYGYSRRSGVDRRNVANVVETERVRDWGRRRRRPVGPARPWLPSAGGSVSELAV